MKSFVPQERHQTVRQAILERLDGRELAASVLSKELGQSEREINEHLTHMARAGLVAIVPAECGHCGFVFAGRDRAQKPGKCPSCKSSRIFAPSFTLQALE